MSQKKTSSRKYCRVCAGEEITVGSGDTPGFCLQSEDTLEKYYRGLKKLQLKRSNSRKFIQSSMSFLQSWRANCDVKVLIYDTDPTFPDLEEISNVCDYIISYTCKGHQTLFQEKDIIKSTITRYVHIYIYVYV